MPYLPDAVTRKEKYYQYLATGTGVIPDPVTREEQYLYYLCKNGGTGGEVTPEQIQQAVDNYLEENPVEPTQIDATLTQSGQAADAKATGDAIEAARNTILEKSIENYYALRRTGKVYQTKIWKYASNPTPTGEKLLDNSGLLFEPSTDTVEGQDDYLNGQHPLFEWVYVNYVRDENGMPHPTAIEGDSNFRTSGAVDVGSMQMSFWWKRDTSNADYDLITISDLPHPELGLVPWSECASPDGSVLPWCIGSAFFSSEASDGMPRSQPGAKPERNQSHNNMITNYQEKGSGYWGAGADHNTFQIVFNAIKLPSKSSQSGYAGVSSWNFQYEASVQRSDEDTFFPVTNSQAANLVVGGYVSIGYGSNNSGEINIDRGQSSVHAYADDVKILKLEAMEDGQNTAVYLDIEGSGFTTEPHDYGSGVTAPIIMSSMHAWSGLTMAVKGHHDGSPVSNTDGKHPYRVQGREYMVGGYQVASDTVINLNSDFTKDVYVSKKGTAHSAVWNTILSTYKKIGTIPAAAAGNNADWLVGDYGIDEETGGWWPATEGSGSSQGTGDRVYAGGASATTGQREYLQGGLLWDGSYAGSSYLDCGGGLGAGGWRYLSRD